MLRQLSRLLLHLGSAGLLLAGSAPLAEAAGPRLVQTAFQNNGTLDIYTCVASFPSNNTAGNLILVAVTLGGTPPVRVPTLSDTQGNTYYPATAQLIWDTTGGGSSAQLFYAPDVKGGPNTITMCEVGGSDPMNGNAFNQIAIFEYAGLALTSPLDVAATSAGTTTATGQTITGGSATTTVNGDLIFGYGNTFGGTLTPGLGFTARQPGVGLGEDLVQTTAGAIAATATDSAGNDPYVMLLAAFKPATASNDVTPPSIPTGLSAAAAFSSQINLSWNASTDSTSPVAGYKIFRNGVLVGTAPSTLYQDIGLAAATSYSYTVAAYDPAGNSSTQSTSASASTKPAGSCYTPPLGLVGWWTGDGTANDLVGTNNGVLQGGATATAVGLVGQAFGFDGNTGYVQMPDSPALRPTNLTVEAWVRFAALDSTGSSAAGQQFIVFKQNTRSSSFEGFSLIKSRGGSGDFFEFTVTSAAGESAYVDSAPGIQTNVWYHVAGVRGPNVVELYVNGQLAGQVGVGFPQDYGSFPLYFGTSGQSYWDHKLSGSLDEVSLYSRALSANEIATIYAAGASGKCRANGGLSFTLQPQSQSIAAGSNALFTASATGTAPLHYQWRFNNAAIAGATNTGLTLTNVQNSNAGNYTAVVTNATGAITSAVAVLTVVTRPAISSPPQSRTNVAGTTASFSATATGTAPLNYQWQFNGLNLTNGGRLSGVTTNVLTITSVSAADGGNYALRVSNLAGAVTSSVAVLTVTGPPVITAQPTGQTVTVGSNATFAVTATGTQPLGYRWLFNGTNLVNGGQFSGVSTATLSIANVQGGNAGGYAVVVTNTSGSVTSVVAGLTVLPSGPQTGPVLPLQPNQTVNELTSLIVTNTASDGNGVFAPRSTNTIIFNYPNRDALAADGWSFIATHADGTPRDTEITDPAVGAVVSYDQTAHPGVLRIPCDLGDLWGTSYNNTRNSLFRSLSPNWLTMQLAFAFAPTQDFHQAHITVYQDDDNYIEAGLAHNTSLGGEVTPVVSEVNAQPSHSWVTLSSGLTVTNIHLRLDRDPNTGNVSGYYSVNGTTWVLIGTFGQTLVNPRLMIWVGASDIVFGAGSPNFDVQRLDVVSSNAAPVLTYRLVNPPAGATIDGSGVIRWTPSELQGPGTNVLTTVVTDNGLPPLSATNSFTVVVNEVNNAPALPAQPDRGIVGPATLVVTNTATDSDVPANSLTYQLVGAPTNAVISASGVITWTPTASQIPSSATFTTVVTDFNPAAAVSPHLSATNSFNVTVTASGTCVTPPAGIVGWWPGEGGVGDLISTNNGVLQGGATANGNGLVGQAFSFDGASGFVQIPDSPLLKPANLTVEAWVLFTSLDSSGTSPAGQQYIIFKQNTRTSNFEGYSLIKARGGSGDYFAFSVSSAAGQTAEVDAVPGIQTNVWYHVAGVRGTNFVQLYVNGQLAGQVAASFAQDYGTLPLFFGTSGQSYWDHKLAGLLDEVSLYNRALSAAEVASIYNARSAGKCRVGLSITAQPQSLSVVSGGNAQFTVGALGAGPLGYQWLFNGSAISGATNSSLSISSVQPGNAGNYTAVVTNTSGSATSAVAVLTVLVPPALTSQPQSSTNTAGTSVSFTAAATGTAPLGYAWRFNGLSLINGGRISGANTNLLSITNIQPADGGNYTLVVSNIAGVVTSAVAVLTVTGPPLITAQPVNQTVVAGSNATISVTATGTQPLSYQWLFNGANLTNAGQFAGVTGPVLTIGNVQPANAGGYSVVVTNVAGNATSAVAVLTVNLPGSCVTPPAGLVGWWPGDGNANDITGTNNGTLVSGATATAKGLVAQAFGFDGANAYVQIPDSALLKPTNLTVEAWVLFAGLDSTGSSPAGQQYIVFKQNTRTSYFEGYSLIKARSGSGDYFAFAVSSAAGQTAEVDSAPGIQPNVWYHVAGIRGTNFVALYVNGQLAAQTSVNFVQDYGSLPLFFGTSGESYWDHKLNGSLDEVSLYNRALSGSEIAALYAAGSAGKCKGVALPAIAIPSTLKLNAGTLAAAVTQVPVSLSYHAGQATVELAFQGTPDRNYEIQWSASVVGPWAWYATATADKSGAVAYTGPAPAHTAFFRVVVP